MPLNCIKMGSLISEPLRVLGGFALSKGRSFEPLTSKDRSIESLSMEPKPLLFISGDAFLMTSGSTVMEGS